MWSKLFRNKSKKTKIINSSENENVNLFGSDANGTAKSKLSRVVNSFSLKRNGQCVSATPVNFENFNNYRDYLQSDPSKEIVSPQSDAFPIDISLEPCPICTRTFAPRTLKKHISICEKMAIKKRKKFDSSRQRREGTDLADFLPKNFGLPSSKQKSEPPPAERMNISQSSTPMPQKKQLEPAKSVPLPKKVSASVVNVAFSAAKEKPTKPVLSRLVPVSEQCPHCDRSFGPKAYDRHVDWCKEKTRLSNYQQNSSINIAKERLQARTKYRAPSLKTKRGVNREKYSGLSCEESANSLSDGGGGGFGESSKKPNDFYEEEDNFNMSASSSVMSTSLMSDGISHIHLFDKDEKKEDGYDAGSDDLVEILEDETNEKLIANEKTLHNRNDMLLNKSKINSNHFNITNYDGNSDEIEIIEIGNEISTVVGSMFEKSDVLLRDSKELPYEAKGETTTYCTDNSSNDLTYSVEDEEPQSEREDEDILQCQLDSKSLVLRQLADRYDPFLSAKRQLEELCSPTDAPSTTVSVPATPNIINTKFDSPMSTSFTFSSRRKSDNSKSDFHRTFSLRVPRKKTTPPRTVLPTCVKQKSTIQRGISDEGPISTSFLKSEEYDEMPVKSVCINDFATTSQRSDSQNGVKVVKRDPAIISRNRRNQRFKAEPLNTPLSKTDSLAIFLQYENDTRVTEIPITLTEKELKDKSNNLSKKTSVKSSESDLDCLLVEKDNSDVSKNSSLSKFPDPINVVVDSPLLGPINKTHVIKLKPLPKIPDKSVGKQQLPSLLVPDNPHAENNSFIDPKLINICDNLPINLTKLSDNDLTTSSSESIEKARLELESPSQQPTVPAKGEIAMIQSVSNRSSIEKRNLKRQLRLGRNQFLYDVSPENDNIAGNFAEGLVDNIVKIDSNKSRDSHSLNIAPSPNEFDIEEFISSFEDSDNYPLFKVYKEFLSNNSFSSKLSNNSRESSRSPIAASDGREDNDCPDIEKKEIFSSNESFLKHETESNPLEQIEMNLSKSQPSQLQTTDSNGNDKGEKSPHDDDETDKANLAEVNINRNDLFNFETPVKSSMLGENLNSKITSTDTNTPTNDLEKLSSIDSFEIRSTVSSKQSADSAYSSLSRHSGYERNNHRTTLNTNKMSTTYSPHPQLKTILSYDSKSKTHRGCTEFSTDSSSSDEACKLANQVKFAPMADDPAKADVRMTKFCHECGSKFILPNAKFCVECGAKRLALG